MSELLTKDGSVGRAPAPIDGRQVERAGRVWRAAQRTQREALTLLAFGYPGEFFASLEWEQHGQRSREDIARGLARLCLLIRQAAVEPQGVSK